MAMNKKKKAPAKKKKTLSSHSKSLKTMIKKKSTAKPRGKITMGKPIRKTTKRKGTK